MAFSPPQGSKSLGKINL